MTHKSHKYDVLQPFLLENPNIRGRIVRLDKSINDVLSAHNYPDTVSFLLGEALVLTSLLAGMLKYEGVFTFQIKGDGPVPTLVCDLTHEGHLRGYAAYDQEAIEKMESSSGTDLSSGYSPSLKELIGKGYLAFTVDQGENHNRYQGMVEMHGETMSEWVRHYFSQSEQVKTAFKIFVDHEKGGQWQASGLMLQSLPEKADDEIHMKTNVEADGWRRVMMLMDTASHEEMLSYKIDTNDMLFRLFHEEVVRVFDPVLIKHACRCNREKIETILITLSSEEISDYTVDNALEVDCQFCSRKYRYSQEDVKRLRDEKGDTRHA